MVEIPTTFEDWGSNQWSATPLTSMEAMVTSLPFEDIDALDVKLVLRDALVDCFDLLDPEDQFVIEAVWFERVTIRELAERLGIQKSRTHRICQRAVKRLGVLCVDHPVVREAIRGRTRVPG